MSQTSTHAVLTQLDQQLDSTNCAVAIIDLQNDFLSPDGLIAQKKGVEVTSVHGCLPAVNALVTLARAKQVPVIWIRVVHTIEDSSPAYLAKYLGDIPQSQWSADKLPAQEGSWGAEWYEGVFARKEHEPEILKRTYSGFFGTHLDLLLRAQGIRTLLMAGCNTNVCVQATASDAFYNGYHSVIVQDACGSVTPEMHETALTNHQKWFGAVTTVPTLEALWG